MLVVNIDKINMFRKAVLFYCFIDCYSEEFSELHPSDEYDCLLANVNKTNKKCAIFFLENPSDTILQKYKKYSIFVYYIKAPKDKDDGIIRKELSKEYIHKIVIIGENSFSQISDDSILIRNFKKSNTIKLDEIYYKYYSNDMKDKSILNQILYSGLVGFANPELFNDPFDCDYQNAVTGEKKDKFKVLCLTPNDKNILMWSYYGNNHKGYCLGYNKDLILQELDKHYSGICFIGNVNYRKKRPAYKVKKSLGLMDEILFYINCLFTKFEEWSHENEYRMVIINSKEYGDYFSINTTVMDKKVGCEFAGTVPTNFNKLTKDPKDYLLK